MSGPDSIESFLAVLNLPPGEDAMLPSSERQITHTVSNGARPSVRLVGGNHAFVLPADVLQCNSTLLNGVLADAEFGEENVIDLPLQCDHVSFSTLAIVSSWLRHQSESAVPDELTPAEGSKHHPPRNLANTVVENPWVRDVLRCVVPEQTKQISVPSALIRSAPHCSLQLNNDPTDSKVSVVTLTTGVVNLKLAHKTLLLSVFLQIERLSNLLAAYILHVTRKGIRDFRAFDVPCEVPDQASVGHPSLDFVKRSLALRSFVTGDPAIDSDEQDAIENAGNVDWLRETGTNMKLLPDES